MPDPVNLLPPPSTSFHLIPPHSTSLRLPTAGFPVPAVQAFPRVLGGRGPGGGRPLGPQEGAGGAHQPAQLRPLHREEDHGGGGAGARQGRRHGRLAESVGFCSSVDTVVIKGFGSGLYITAL